MNDASIKTPSVFSHMNNILDLTGVQHSVIESGDVESLRQNKATLEFLREKRTPLTQQDYAVVALPNSDFYAHRLCQHPCNRSGTSPYQRLHYPEVPRKKHEASHYVDRGFDADAHRAPVVLGGELG